MPPGAVHCVRAAQSTHEAPPTPTPSVCVWDTAVPSPSPALLSISYFSAAALALATGRARHHKFGQASVTPGFRCWVCQGDWLELIPRFAHVEYRDHWQQHGLDYCTKRAPLWHQVIYSERPFIRSAEIRSEPTFQMVRTWARTR